MLKIFFDFAFDFQQRLIIFNYYTFMDIFAILGGILAAFKPVFGIATPIIILVFLLKVAHAVKENHRKAYRNGLNQIFGKSLSQLRKIKEISELQYDDW